MENKINVAELLKDCEKGMELDCILFKDTPAFFYGVITDTNYPIEIKVEYPSKELETFFLNKYGAIYDRPTSNCVIFPKGKTTWEGFQRPFMDGDIVVCTNGSCTFTAIFKSMRNDSSFYRYGVMFDNKFRCLANDWSDFNDSCRLATEEEKQKLFQAIKNNGYNWNAETKTLEKYKEETMKKNQPHKTQADVDKYLQEHSVKNGMNVIDIETCLEMDGLKLPENVVINSKGIGSIQFIQWYEKLQYPKTYEECCKMLGYSGNYNMILTTDVDNKLFNALYRLKVCRDAYWKIAGEQMGLGKHWKPDWNHNTEKYVIYPYQYLYSIDKENYRNTVLAFPTAEMRDAFYENFKELIDKCKELL